MTKTNYPLGPKGNLLTGNIPEFRGDPLGFLTMCAREYGPVVGLRFGRIRAYLINDPSYIENIFVTNKDNFIKAKALRALDRLLGNGLLTNEGDSWMHQRKIAQPSFYRDRINSYADTMVKCTKRITDKWREGEVYDIHEQMKRLTLNIVGQTLFSTDLSNETSNMYDALQKVMDQYEARRGITRLIPDFVPTPSNLRYRQAVNQLEEVVCKIIQDRRENESDTHDLLSTLLEARDENGNTITDKQLRDELITVLLGGYDTPTLALSWIWFLLSEHTLAAKKLMAEIEEVLGGRSADASDITQLPYTQMVVKEGMRLYPPAWIMSREAIDGCKIGDYDVPSGTQLIISQWVTHRDPKYFDNPEEFIPERWEDKEGIRTLPKYSYFPFGGGPRVCIGSSFAATELVLILVTIAQKFRLKLVPGFSVIPWPSLTLRPKNGIKMMVKSR